MLRPFLAMLLGRTKPLETSPLSKEAASGDALAPPGDPAMPERERLPPRDDSFYLGICFSHW